MTSFGEALARRLEPASSAPLVVAYSGGGDSTALLYLILASSKRAVLAATVDHGLHPESARLTAEAGERARAMGASWLALRWEGPKPSTGIQAKARAARHALLVAAAREAGARVILMGHTRDDVLEGEVMRAGDAPALGRLREWAPSPVWPEGRGVFLLRPLLAVRRDELRSYLRELGLPWFDDPANEDQRFARVRARGVLTCAHPGGRRDPEKAARIRPNQAHQELASDSDEAKTWVPASAGMSGIGWAEGAAIAPKPFLARTTLPPLLLSVSGRTVPPRGAEVDRLMQTIAAGGVATLSGCRIDARRDSVRIERAPPRRGEQSRPFEPIEWMRYRFEAAIGLYPDEISIPQP